MEILQARPAARPDVADELAPQASAWPRRVLVTAIFAAAVLVMLRPTWHSLDRTLTNLGDPAFEVWTFEWGRHALLTNPIHVFNANIFWPHGLALAYSENMLVMVPVTAPVRWLGGSWALALNVFVLAALALSLGATYSLARYLTARTDAAVIAALAFSFSSFVFSHLGHAQLLTLGLFPLGLLLLFRTLEERRTGLAVLTGLTTGSFVLGALYYAVIWGVVVVVVLVGYVLLAGLRPGPGLARALAVTAVVAAVVVVPVAVQYVRLQHESGLKRATVPRWGFKAADLVTPVPHPLLEAPLDHWARDRDTRWEHELYLGLVTLALATAGAAALATRLRRDGSRRRDPSREGRERPPRDRRRLLLLLVASGLASFAVAAGPTVLGVRSTPFRFLYDHVPGFNAVRVTARLAAPGLLALAVLAAYGFAAATRRLGATGRAVLAVVVGGLVLLELAAPLQHVTLPDDHATLAVYHALSRRPRGPVIELPMAPLTDGTRWATLEAPRMVYSSIDWNRRVNGYSGDWPPDYPEDVAVLNRFPAPDALARLRGLRVRYVVLHVGPFGGYPQLTEVQARSIVEVSRAIGLRAARYGNAWLVDLCPGGCSV